MRGSVEVPCVAGPLNETICMNHRLELCLALKVVMSPIHFAGARGAGCMTHGNTQPLMSLDEGLCEGRFTGPAACGEDD